MRYKVAVVSAMTAALLGMVAAPAMAGPLDPIENAADKVLDGGEGAIDKTLDGGEGAVDKTLDGVDLF